MSVSSAAQFFTVLIIFILVLGLTFYVTRWIARYQKVSGNACNMEILETMRLSQSQCIQIVRIASKYMAIAVCKDSVTVICELSEDEYEPPLPQGVGTPDFSKEFSKVLERFKKK